MNRVDHNPLGNGLPRSVLQPGEFRSTREPMVLSTLLGSCVAVCLYDAERGVMGMNHFLLAERRFPGGDLLATEAGRYGIHAMELLINSMIALGARRSRLQAKAFGGANVLGRPCTDEDDYYCIGEVNIRFVRGFLDNDGIPLVASDLGGRLGRLVHFSAPDYAVFLRRIRSSLGSVVDEEKRFLQRTREQQRRAVARASVEFW